MLLIISRVFLSFLLLSAAYLISNDLRRICVRKPTQKKAAKVVVVAAMTY